MILEKEYFTSSFIFFPISLIVSRKIIETTTAEICSVQV